MITGENRMDTVKVAELVEDLSLYPRTSVSDFYVSQLAEAMRAGTILPPIIADEKSHRIVDGIHRCRAALRVSGPNAEIAVVWKSYSDDVSLLKDAIAANAQHGRRMSNVDLVRCTHLGQKLGLDVETIASLASITLERLDGLVTKRTAYAKNGSPVVLRAGLSHLAGQHLTKTQMEANRKSFGNVQLYAERLADLLETKALDLTDERLRTELVRLREVLNRIDL